MSQTPYPAPDSRCAPSKRLPVNPRRHKVAPEERKRVVRACNACNNRRVKCTGGQPCQRCVKTSRDCEYTAADTDRVSLKDELERLRARCSTLEEGVTRIAPLQAPSLLQQVDRGETPAWASVVPSPASTPSDDDFDDVEGRLLYDPDGTARYLGESSGATFLDQLKQFMVTLMAPLEYTPEGGYGSTFVDSVGHYQTFDSRPLANPDVDPTWLPSKTDMASMLQELRQYIQDGNGTFVSGGIHWWGDLSSVPVPCTDPTPMIMLTTDDSNRHLAFYHVCFALSVSIRHTSLRLPDCQSGEAFFKRARLLLGNPMDTVRFSLSDVSALALMGYYLIQVNRRDAAYMYVSIAVHIAIIHGSFRHATDEASKRTFWTLYIVDRWISMLMGRPPIIPDEAIRLPLPVDAPSMPPAVGLRANVGLAKISTYVVCETYGIAPRRTKAVGTKANIDAALKRLHNWHSQLPIVLQIPADLSLLDPACCTMHMSYNQLIILTTRPAFFALTKKIVAQQIFGKPGSLDELQGTHTRSCVEAAQRNIELARHLQSTNCNWLQSGLHFLFNAGVVLLLGRISSACVDGVDSDSIGSYSHAAEIHFAIQVFEQEAKTGTNYPRDCYRVLLDLKALTDRFVLTPHLPSLHQCAMALDDPWNFTLHPNRPVTTQSAPLQYSHRSNGDHNTYHGTRPLARTDGSQQRNSSHLAGNSLYTPSREDSPAVFFHSHI